MTISRYWILVIILFCQQTFAQTPEVSIQYSENALPEKQQVRLRRQLQTADTALASKRLYRFLDHVRSEGYAEASIDRFIHSGDSIFTTLYIGPLYQLGKLELVNLPPEHRLQLKNNLLPRPFSRQQIGQKLENILHDFQAKGYPFAAFSAPETRMYSIGKDSIGISQRYEFEAGPLVKIDSIRLRGKLREPEKLIYQLMRVRPGDFYRQNYINEIPRLLDNTPYFERSSPPVVRFLPNGNAVLDIRLKRQRAGKFDLLLGLLPPDDPNQSRLRITGLVDAVFVSALEMVKPLNSAFADLGGLCKPSDWAMSNLPGGTALFARIFL
ncbi:MAG: hypothetical protein R3B47_01900 [Bacteroidia bacterium]